MKYGNELKVGIAVVLAVAVFVIGVRYFEDIPIFGGTYDLYTQFDNAGGLVRGSVVRINGVNVGRVEQIRLGTSPDSVLVYFSVDNTITIPRGSHTFISGISALGTVQVGIKLGDRANPAVPPGGFVPPRETGGLGDLLDRAPDFADKADSILVGANALLGEVQTLVESPQSDLHRTLRAIERSAAALETLVQAERVRVARVLTSVDTLATNLGRATSGIDGDSLAQTVERLNAVLARLDQNLAGIEASTATLDGILMKIDQGQGTLGLLVNDPTLYTDLQATVANLNRILNDFENNPKKYLKDLKLVDVF